MNSLFSPQRTSSGQAVFSAQAGAPVVALVAGGVLSASSTLTTGALAVINVFIDEPAPHSRCVFMDFQNRAIRL